MKYEEYIENKEGFIDLFSEQINLSREDAVKTLTNECKFIREKKYPDIKEQLDAIFHDISNDTLNQNGKFYSLISNVKEQFPKPE